MRRALALGCLLTFASQAVRAQTPPERVPAAAITTPAPSATAPLRDKYALFRLDPLGISTEIVDQLEHILRAELQSVVGQTLPTRATVDRLAAENPKLAACTADPACLAPLARALEVTRVVAGNVGGLGDSYVVNLKLVDATGRELRRVAATLQGSPEELIDGVRVATFRLVAPERVVGAVEVLSDVPGASVSVDGAPLGRTPLPGPLTGLPAGVHRLRVERAGFSDFEEEVPVRFEKTTQVLVHQNATGKASVPIHRRWWFWAGVAATAVAAGLVVGYAVPKQSAIDCKSSPKECP